MSESAADSKTGEKRITGAAAMGPGPGRPPGLANKTTRLLKEAILLAAEEVGQDGAGAGGLVGYLRRLAASDPRAFAGLLGKVLPMQVNLGGEVTFTRIERRVIDPQTIVDQ